MERQHLVDQAARLGVSAGGLRLHGLGVGDQSPVERVGGQGGAHHLGVGARPSALALPKQRHADAQRRAGRPSAVVPPDAGADGDLGQPGAQLGLAAIAARRRRVRDQRRTPLAGGDGLGG